MKVHAAIARALSDHGVDTIFGLVGDANLFVVSSFVGDNSGTYVAAASEAGAVLMANGYASVRGNLGVATVTHGPGLTNTFTALVEGVRNNTPLLVIAGDTAASDKGNIQNITQRDVVIPTGAGFEQVRSPQSVVEDVAAAIRRALAERRPVVLNIPIDFQWEEVSYHAVIFGQEAVPTTAPDDVSLEVAVGIIAASNRPILLAGRGAASAVAKAALLRLSERIGAPVATTLRCKDLFRGEEADLGVFGTLCSPVALEAIMRSDCIIAFGAGLNQLSTDFGALLQNKRLVHCDIEQRNIGKHVAVDAAIVGDAGAVADTIVRWLDDADVKMPGNRLGLLKKKFAEYSPVGEFKDQSGNGTIDIRTAICCLEDCVPQDRTVVVDVGRFLTEVLKYVHVPSPQAYVHTVNFGSIGLGMGNAIGAALGAPGRPVLLLSGDGGFMLGGLAEFNTAVRNAVDLIAVVFNDGAYGAEHIQIRNRGLDPSITMCDWPDLASVATVLGGHGIAVRSIEELGLLPDLIAQRSLPLLIDVKLDPDKVPNHRH